MNDETRDQHDPLDEVIAEYLRAVEAGKTPDRDEFITRHPELAESLRGFFADQQRIARVAAPLKAAAARRMFVPPTIRYFGDYELLEEIARGGMGVVYKARQSTLGRIVAVKMILSGQLADEEDVKRFQTEAQAAARLRHPQIVSIHEVGVHEGRHYFSMDYVDGRSLAEIVREKVLPARQAATYVRQAAEAIHYAHQQGTLHRDLKPSNLLIDGRDQVCVTDFGLAMRVEGDSELTRTGQIVGSPSYMPPEQAQGKRGVICVASDVYALGAVLYECLTGRPPFRADSAIETIQQVIQADAASPRLLNPSVPRDLETICLKCLQKVPQQRYSSAQLLADDLTRFLQGETIAARRIGPPARAWRWCRRNPAIAGLAAAIVVIVLAAILAGVGLRRGSLRQQQMTRAETLVEGLMHADTAQTPAIVAEIGACREFAEPSLRERFRRSADHSVEKLHAALALLPWDAGQAGYLCEELLRVTPAQFPVLRDALEPHASTFVESLWTVAADSGREAPRRFQAACALASYAPNDARWQSVGDFAARRLVELETSELVAWRAALRPARKQLVGPLAAICQQADAREQARIYAAETLADYAGDSPEVLFSVLTDAAPFQFAVLWKALEKHCDEAIELGAALLNTQSERGANPAENEAAARRRANAALALYEFGAADRIWSLLKRSPDPLARSYFIHWLSPRGADPHALIRHFDDEPDASVRSALLLALGEFSEHQLPAAERAPLIDKLVAAYERDPDAGLHGAAEWLLRKWGRQQELDAVNEKLAGRLPAERQQWYVNSQGHTFVIFEPGEFEMGSPTSEPDRNEGEAQRRVHAGRFAIATHEVTQADFNAFAKQRSTGPPSNAAPNANPANAPQPVAWYAAAAYCNWLSEREGLTPEQWCYEPNASGVYGEGMRAKPNAADLPGYRLPTEAEWEYACRAGTVASRYYGDAESLLPDYAWHQFNRNDRLRPVGLLKPNDAGLFDMLGNSYEWCHAYTTFRFNADSAWFEDSIDATPVPSYSRRPLRGGAFNEHSPKVRCACRVGNQPNVSNGIEGFRPVRRHLAPTEEERAAERSRDPLVKRDIDLLWLRGERALEAARRLGERGVEATAAIPALSVALNDGSNSSLQHAAGQALGRIGAAAAPVLLRATLAADSQQRSAAAEGLLQLRNRPAEAAEAIRRQLQDADPEIRRAAVLALRELPDERQVLDDLQARLKDDSAGVRQAAAHSLGAIGANAPAAIPALIRALDDEQLAVARAAAAALAQAGAGSDAAAQALLAASRHEDRRRRPGALAALRRLDVRLAEEQLGPPFDAVEASLQDRQSLRVGPGDWPQWGGSRLRNNTPDGLRIPVSWDVASGQNIKWTAKLGSQTYGNPSVANGKVFIGTNNGAGYLKRYPATMDLGVMLCFDEATGEFLWQYSSEKLPTGRVHDWPLQGMPSTPVVDGDRLWAVTNRCEVVCLDAEGFHDGENDGPFIDEVNKNVDEADVVWKLDMMKELGVSPHNMSNCSMAIADGRLFVCTSNGVDEGHSNLPAPQAPSFLALDCTTGQVLWTDNSPGYNILHGQWASPSYCVFAGQPQVIFPGGDGWLYAFEPAGDGRGKSRLLWKFDCNPKDSKFSISGRSTRNELIGFVCIYDGLLYVATGEDPEHGEGIGQLWCLNPAHHLKGADISAELAVDRVGNVVPHRRLCAVDPAQGESTIPNPRSAVVWQYSQADRNADGRIDFEEKLHRSLSTPVIRDDILYIADYSGLFHCLDAKTGEFYWNYDLLSACWGSALIVQGCVYIGDEGGAVRVFRHSADPAIALPDGDRLAQNEMPEAIYSTPIVANNVLYIATKNKLFAIQSGEETPPDSPP